MISEGFLDHIHKQKIGFIFRNTTVKYYYDIWQFSGGGNSAAPPPPPNLNKQLHGKCHLNLQACMQYSSSLKFHGLDEKGHYACLAQSTIQAIHGISLQFL